MANAAYRWRLTIAKKGPTERAFVGMEAVIISSKMNGTVESLTRVVRSGGGKVLPVEYVPRHFTFFFLFLLFFM